MGGLMPSVLGGAIYGLARAPVANAIAPLTSKIPIPSQYSDNLGMAVLAYFAMKKGTGLVRDVGKAGLVIESALLAQDVAGGAIGGGMTQSAQTNSQGAWGW